MAIAVPQEFPDDDNIAAGSTQTSGTATVTVNNFIALFSPEPAGGGVTVTGVADGLSNTYTQRASLNIGGRLLYAHTAPLTTGGSCQATTTYSGSTTLKGCWPCEISQCSAYDTSSTQFRSNPGTGTDAIVSASVTPSSQPALVIGIATSFAGSAVTGLTGGTGQTNGTGAFDYGFGMSGRTTWKRVTSTSATTLTWTDATGGGTNGYYLIVLVFTEAAAGGAPAGNALFFGAGV